MEKKNLDRLFQEQFRDYEVAPPDHVWPAIEAELNRKKKRRVIPLWYKLSGVAALLVIGLGIYATIDSGSSAGSNTVVAVPVEGNEKSSSETNSGSKSDTNDINNETPVIVQSDVVESRSDQNTGENVSLGKQVVSETNGSKPSGGKSRIKNSSKSAVVSADKNRNAKSNTSPSGIENGKSPRETGIAIVNESPSEQKQNNVGSENALEKSAVQTVKVERPIKTGKPLPNEGIAQSSENNTSVKNETQAEKPLNINPASEQNAVVQANQAETQPDSTAVATVEPNALEELLNEKENNVTAGEQKINRWQITSSVAPIYFSSVSNGSPIDSRLTSTNKTYKPSVSYGAGVSYAVSKKLSVRAGVNSLAFEYSTNDLVFFQTQNARQLENVKTNAPGSLIEIDRNPGMITAANAEAKNLGKRFDGVLNQRTGYIEVPMEMTYRLLDRKFGVNLIGGVSTLFLNENSVSLESPGMDMVIGEADNLNQVHFSTNVGVGFNYRFLKSFEARFDPMFKYQINTYSNGAGNFKPYFFGLYTGISYRF